MIFKALSARGVLLFVAVSVLITYKKHGLLYITDSNCIILAALLLLIFEYYYGIIIMCNLNL